MGLFIHMIQQLKKNNLRGKVEMKVTSCSFNSYHIELNLELSKEEFNQPEEVIKEKALILANEILEKFGQSINLVLSKYLVFDEDMSILCVFLVAE